MAERFFSVVAFEATSLGMDVRLTGVRNLHLGVDQCTVFFVPMGSDSQTLAAMCSFSGATIIEHDEARSRRRWPTSALVLSKFA
jgi:hypothetical protein